MFIVCIISTTKFDDKNKKDDHKVWYHGSIMFHVTYTYNSFS